MKNLSIAALLGGAALILAGCGGGSEEAREKKMEDQAAKYGIDADVELDDDGEVKSVEIKGVNGAKVGTGLDLPDGFPEDVSVSEGWNIAAVSPAPGGFSINAMTDEDVDAIVAFAREKMTAGGWTETQFRQPVPQMTTINFEKDARLTAYTIMNSGAQNSVQLVTMKKP